MYRPNGIIKLFTFLGKFIPPIWRTVIPTGKALRLLPCRPRKSSHTKNNYRHCMGRTRQDYYKSAAQRLSCGWRWPLCWRWCQSSKYKIPASKVWKSVRKNADQRQIFHVFCNPVCWACCSNNSQDSNQGFPPSGISLSTDGAEKIAVFYVVCNCFPFRKVGALWRRPVLKRGVWIFPAPE